MVDVVVDIVCVLEVLSGIDSLDLLSIVLSVPDVEGSWRTFALVNNTDCSLFLSSYNFYVLLIKSIKNT